MRAPRTSRPLIAIHGCPESRDPPLHSAPAPPDRVSAQRPVAGSLSRHCLFTSSATMAGASYFNPRRPKQPCNQRIAEFCIWREVSRIGVKNFFGGTRQTVPWGGVTCLFSSARTARYNWAVGQEIRYRNPAPSRYDSPTGGSDGNLSF